MFCKKCGNQIGDGALFCNACGNRIDADATGKTTSDTKKIEETELSLNECESDCKALCGKLYAICQNADISSREKKICTALYEGFDAISFCIDKIHTVILELKEFEETLPQEDDVYLRESYFIRMTEKIKEHSEDIKELIVLCKIDGIKIPHKKDAESVISKTDNLCHMAYSVVKELKEIIERRRVKNANVGYSGGCANIGPCNQNDTVATKVGVKGAPKRGFRDFLSMFRKKDKYAEPQTFTLPDIMFDESASESFDASIPTEHSDNIPEIDLFKLADVQFSALVQKEVSREEYMSVDIIMYEDDFRKIVDERLDETIKEVRKHYYGVADNSKIKVVLTSKGAEIDDSSEEYIWQGKYLEFSFLACVPEEYEGKQVSFCATVYVNDLIATRLNIVVGIRADGAHTTEIKRDDINTAFISYSSADRIRVSSIIQGMQKMRPDLDVFMDVESLRSGEDWQSKLRNEIDNRDVLFLCWSKSAKASKWVDFEWRYALERKGEESIEPLPVDPAEMCEPPIELSKKHFNDKMAYLVKALEYMSNKTPYISVCEYGINKKICITGDEFIIGRDKNGTDYSISNPKVSKFHARIVKDNGQYFLIDLDSVNKTYVDGAVCVPGIRTPIGSGSVIKLADEELLFELA